MVAVENFSQRAQGVIAAAAVEARHLHHPRIGTEHLLLGLLAEGGDSADVLRAAGASLSAARHTVAEVAGAGGGQSAQEPTEFTARAQRALDRAGRFSRQDRYPEVTEAHVLLGVLDVEGLACQVLRGLDVDIVRLRGSVVVDRRKPETHERPTALDDPDSARPRCPRCRSLLDDTLTHSVVSARDEDEDVIDVRVIYCRSCGSSLGALALEQ